MRNTIRWTTLAVAVLAATSIGATAQHPVRTKHPGPEGGMPPGPPHARIEAILDLTDAQQASLKAMHEEQRRAADPIVEELRGIHRAIQQGLESETPDATALGEKLIAAHAAQKRLEQLHAAGREKLAGLLTDEQRQKLEAYEKEHGPIGGPWMRGRMRGPGPGRAGGPVPPPQP